MTELFNRIKLARQAGNVTRYHTQSLIKPENVAQHTFNMVNIIMLLTERQVRAELIFAAIAHDMGEYTTGDIPSPSKRAMDDDARKELNKLEDWAMQEIHHGLDYKLSTWEYHLLKTADNLDGLMKCIEEKNLGNRSIDVCAKNYIAYLESMALNLEFMSVTGMQVITDAIEDYNHG